MFKYDIILHNIRSYDNFGSRKMSMKVHYLNKQKIGKFGLDSKLPEVDILPLISIILLQSLFTHSICFNFK